MKNDNNIKNEWFLVFMNIGILIEYFLQVFKFSANSIFCV